ncbi:DeoR family transcriptional regulator [Ruminococcus sp.]|uniref:DeoR family transcriptional regulator n=1 Tax=Ruminococcus sp. TaxID=41978 RepID=UPI0025F230B2|nr:DeoR family transcriptional regulator [Ruminococcus sp.]
MYHFNRTQRILSIFLRLFQQEELQVRQMCDDYHVSTKTIYRDLQEIRCFFCNSSPESEYVLIYKKEKNCFLLQKNTK